MQFPSLKAAVFSSAIITFFGCSTPPVQETTPNTVVDNPLQDTSLNYQPYTPSGDELVINRSEYKERLEGFWLAQCIANWTGLVTEMDKIGDVGKFQTGPFYTREDWGKPDLPSIWGQGVPSDLSPTIDFVVRGPEETWGADDDTDIEYIYQHLLYQNKTSMLTGQQIADGWIAHMRHEEENYLWVSNDTAFKMMLHLGMIPPATGDPENNPEFEMIDAQLTTEIFGLFAPARKDVAVKMAHLPIQTTAREEAEDIAKFYVSMYALASASDPSASMKQRVLWMAAEARKGLQEGAYPAAMYDFVAKHYAAGTPWETTRDSLYYRYVKGQADGYDITAQGKYCDGCFAAGINFAASIVSLLYGEGDLKETIKIGALSGWDSDNPTATWGGMLGSMLGKSKVEAVFGQKFSDKFDIHRTRRGFEPYGIDTFDRMARIGVYITDRVVLEEMGGGVDLAKDVWYIPNPDRMD